MNLPRISRKLHRIGAVVAALPILVILTSGLFLQLKKEVDWIQPPTASTSGGTLRLPMADALEIIRGIPEMGVASWDDVARMDIRPATGLIKLRATNRWETQIDGATGEVLLVAYRRSDFFEDLHDGSWFHDRIKLWLFLPTGVILFALWITGMYLFLLPYRMRRRRARRLDTRG